MNRLKILLLSSAALVFATTLLAGAQTNSEPKTRPYVVGPDGTPVSAASPDSSAPPLTKVYVYQVCSTSAGCEYIASGQTETDLVHGGTDIYVTVYEIGYGTGETATQGGNLLGSSYLVSWTSLCETLVKLKVVYGPCSVGQTVVGFAYEWNVAYYIENNFGDLFAASDTSEVYPYNTYSTSLTIQH